ncbi:MAG: type II toxin-antitoxin system RelE/ParE family toxin [Thermomicrobiales bacterium]
MSRGEYSLDITDRAQRDIRGILQHSLERWGMEQADEYQHRLATAIELLPDNPFMGRLRNDIRPEIRQLLVDRYRVLYIVEDSRVSILRVLHERMDIGLNFDR